MLCVCRFRDNDILGQYATPEDSERLVRWYKYCSFVQLVLHLRLHTPTHIVELAAICMYTTVDSQIFTGKNLA